ncbi:MAG: phosphatidylglycerophosphatase A [Deltaproteobacteria bacterium]|nr:phosphatidylglycerophosphatase A [Deltaproteobacteria bacterium]
MSCTQSDNLSLRQAFQKADFWGKAALALSSWFCAGLLPKAPGTFGTLAGVPIVFFMNYLGVISGALFLILFMAVSLWASGVSHKLLGRNDPPEIVIDEIAGFLVTLSLLPLSWFTLISGFLLFRAFDILKPFPIKRLERLGGGAGIVLDDVLAGIYANLCLRVVIALYAW